MNRNEQQYRHSITQTQWTTDSEQQNFRRNIQYDLPRKNQNTTTTPRISKDKNCLEVDREKHVC
jgi:hypothetical protein